MTQPQPNSIEITEYAGLYVHQTPLGFVVSDRQTGGSNVMPGATMARTREEALQFIDVWISADGIALKFWHLLRAIQRQGKVDGETAHYHTISGVDWAATVSRAARAESVAKAIEHGSRIFQEQPLASDGVASYGEEHKTRPIGEPRRFTPRQVAGILAAADPAEFDNPTRRRFVEDALEFSNPAVDYGRI